MSSTYGPAYRRHCYKQKTARRSGSEKMQKCRRIVKSQNTHDLKVFYRNRMSTSRGAKLYQWHCARLLCLLYVGANSNCCLLDTFRIFFAPTYSRFCRPSTTSLQRMDANRHSFDSTWRALQNDLCLGSLATKQKCSGRSCVSRTASGATTLRTFKNLPFSASSQRLSAAHRLSNEVSRFTNR